MTILIGCATSPFIVIKGSWTISRHIPHNKTESPPDEELLKEIIPILEELNQPGTI